MILELGEDDTEKPKKELSENFTINEADGTDVKVFEKGTIGSIDVPCLCAKYDDNDEYIVSCYSDGAIELYDADSLELVCTLEQPEEDSKQAISTVVKWRPGKNPEHVVAVDVKGLIRKYSTAEKKLVQTITPEEGEDNRLFAFDYSSDGATFATGGTDHFVRVYDDETMKLKTVLDPFYSGKTGHSNRIFCVKYNKANSNLIASAGWDNTIIIHDIRQKGPVSGMLGAYVCGDSLEFFGTEIISGSWRIENPIEIWDTRTTEKSKDVSWDGDNFESENPVRLFCLEKSHHDSINSIMIAGGGESNELRVFNCLNQPVVNITDVSRAIFTCDISHHSDAFLFAGGDGAIRVCKVIIYN